MVIFCFDFMILDSRFLRKIGIGKFPSNSMKYIQKRSTIKNLINSAGHFESVFINVIKYFMKKLIYATFFFFVDTAKSDEFNPNLASFFVRVYLSLNVNILSQAIAN